MSKRKSYKVVYTIVERAGRKFWLRVGAAFTNHDGSLNVYLDATPVNGQLQIRDRGEDDRRKAGGADGGEPALLAAAG